MNTTTYHRAGRDGDDVTFTTELRVVIHGKLYNAHESDLKAAYGLRKQDKWPDAGLPIKVIEGTAVIVRPKGFAPGIKPHRVYVSCPLCRTELPASRLHQHIRSKPCRTA